MQAWSRGSGFEGQSSLRRWLYAIASHVCLDMAKACRRT
ncbi:hypothetical protein [Corynebacterium variabile]|nr:hypothetical protein [Corynebacterium variabile]